MKYRLVVTYENVQICECPYSFYYYHYYYGTLFLVFGIWHFIVCFGIHM